LQKSPIKETIFCKRDHPITEKVSSFTLSSRRDGLSLQEQIRSLSFREETVSLCKGRNNFLLKRKDSLFLSIRDYSKKDSVSLRGREREKERERARKRERETERMRERERQREKQKEGESERARESVCL